METSYVSGGVQLLIKLKSFDESGTERETLEMPNILIVDDSKEVLSSLESALKDEPYKIFLATGGEEALALMTEWPFHVIISDVKMSKMDGFELLDKAKELYPGLTRVVLSGHSDAKLILKIVNEKGIDRYLTKPWQRGSVNSTIKQCIELFDLRKEVEDLRKRFGDQESLK